MTILFNFSAKKSCKEEFKMENPKILIIKQSRCYPSSISDKEEVERMPLLLMTIDLFFHKEQLPFCYGFRVWKNRLGLG